MKVLLIAPIPIDSIILDSKKRNLHPAPWVSEYVKNMKDAISVDVLSLDSKINEAYKKIKKDDINYVFIKVLNPFLSLITMHLYNVIILHKYLKKNASKYDIVHIQGTEHQYYTSMYGIRVPCIISIQGLLSISKKYKKYGIIRLLWSLGSLYEKREIKKNVFFSCRTNWDKSFVKSLNPKCTIFDIWEFIRPEFHGKHCNYSSNKILYVGGGNRIKGIEDTLRALDLLNREGVKLDLYICGYFIEKDIIKYVNDNFLTVKPESLYMMGMIDAIKMIKLMDDSFCLIHPSYIDNSPNSICESQLVGLPVIAYDVGGISSLIEQEETGLLSKRYDYIGLARDIIRLKNDNKLYYKISENSMKIAEKRHNKNHIMNSYLKAYKKIKQYYLNNEKIY